jgi:hypothetical protein
MAENILRKLVNNSQMAIDDGVYEVDVNLKKSSKDFLHTIKTNPHATLLTEVKFASPSLQNQNTDRPSKHCKPNDCRRLKSTLSFDSTTPISWLSRVFHESKGNSGGSNAHERYHD